MINGQWNRLDWVKMYRGRTHCRLVNYIMGRGESGTGIFCAATRTAMPSPRTRRIAWPGQIIGPFCFICDLLIIDGRPQFNYLPFQFRSKTIPFLFLGPLALRINSWLTQVGEFSSKYVVFCTNTKSKLLNPAWTLTKILRGRWLEVGFCEKAG